MTLQDKIRVFLNDEPTFIQSSSTPTTTYLQRKIEITMEQLNVIMQINKVICPEPIFELLVVIKTAALCCLLSGQQEIHTQLNSEFCSMLSNFLGNYDHSNSTNNDGPTQLHRNPIQ
jgi:hypothetical protein